MQLHAVMQMLLAADWPTRLEQHRHSCIRTRALSQMIGEADIMMPDANNSETWQWLTHDLAMLRKIHGDLHA